METPINFDIKPLFKSSDIEIIPQPGVVHLYERMERPEENPDNEWIKLGLVAMKDLYGSGFRPKAVADIGTGNGILAIGAAHIFKPETIYLTDIVERVLPFCAVNVKENLEALAKYTPQVISVAGRDTDPLPDNLVDLFVFSPPPLMITDKSKLESGLTRTTLTEYDHYIQYANGKDDKLAKWSVLPWYVFLLNAKKKMKEHSVILGIYSGRMPFDVITEAYSRAGIKVSVSRSIVKKQQDPIYLKEYADYESDYLNGDTFYFYDFEKAQSLMTRAGIKMPGIITQSDQEIKEILFPAKISALEAYQQSLRGLSVAHIGHALIGTLA